MNGERMADAVCIHHEDRRLTKRVAPVYESLVWELRKQILSLGLTMSQCDDLSGNQDGYTAKMLHANTPTGRQAGWQHVQFLMDVLFCCGGFVMTIRPKADVETIKAEIARRLERRGSKPNGLGFAENARLRGVVGRVPIRDFARFAGSKGGRARAENLSKRQLSEIGRKGARARWKVSTNPKHREQFATKPNGRPLNGPHQK